MAISRTGVVGACFCFAAWVMPLPARAALVRAEDVRVTPVTAAGIQQAVRDSGSRAVLVNIWASWCGPCREEFPGLVRIAREFRTQGLKVIFVSADFDTDLPAVKKFLAEHGVDFPSYIKAEKDQPFIDTLDKRWSGALPATFIYDGAGHLQDFWEGKASFQEVEQKVTKVLQTKPKSTGGKP